MWLYICVENQYKYITCPSLTFGSVFSNFSNFSFIMVVPKLHYNYSLHVCTKLPHNKGEKNIYQSIFLSFSDDYDPRVWNINSEHISYVLNVFHHFLHYNIVLYYYTKKIKKVILPIQGLNINLHVFPLTAEVKTKCTNENILNYI